MNIQSYRLVFLILLTMSIIGCGGREYQAKPIALPEMTETEAIKTPEEVVPPPKTVMPIKRQTATVKGSRLNLRDQATTKSKVLGLLQKGAPLEILSHKDDWLEVATPDGQKGWVYGIYVQLDKKEPDALPQPEQPASPPSNVQTARPVDEEEPKPAQTPPPKAASTKVPALSKQLETLWETHRHAHRDGDLALVQKTTSNHTYGTLQNELAAVGKELKPEDVSFLFKIMPDLAKSDFLELKQNGPTAGLLYLDETEKGDDPNLPAPVRFTFIKFVKETRGWTVDGMQSKGAPKYQKDGSETHFDYAALSNELAIDGKVRPAPKAVEKPKVQMVEGVIDISSFDYKTEVSINGIVQNEAEGITASGPIRGGLKKGANKIEIVVSKSSQAQSDWPPEVAIRHLNASGKEVEGFKFAPEENVEGQHTFTFSVQ